MRLGLRAHRREEVMQVRRCARRDRLPAGGVGIGLQTGAVEHDPGAHVDELTDRGALVGRGRDLRHVARHLGIDVDLAAIREDAEHQAGDRLGRGHQNVRRVAIGAAVIVFEHDVAVLQDQQSVGRRRLQEAIEVERATLGQAQAEIIERNRTCRQGPGAARRALDLGDRQDRSDVVKGPAAERRGAPVGEIGAGGRKIGRHANPAGFPRCST